MWLNWLSLFPRILARLLHPDELAHHSRPPGGEGELVHFLVSPCLFANDDSQYS